MANPIYNALGGGTPSAPAPMGNMMQMMRRFNEFRKTFSGDPKQQVQELLNSGRMTQSQYNELQNMARLLMVESQGRKLSVGRAMLGASSMRRCTGTGRRPLYFRSAT